MKGLFVSWSSIYTRAVQEWDKTHRLVGRLSVSALVEQSVEALKALDDEVLAGDVLFVDVGAGQGLLGIPALYLFPNLKVLFVEPDPKKTAFLRNYLFGVQKELGPRSFVESCRLQDVSRETQKRHENRNPKLFARAFSGEVLLAEAVRESVFSEQELFVFHSDGARHFFEKTC